MSTKTDIEWAALTGRALGVIKTASKRASVSLREYQERVDSGLKYCWPCTAWHDRAAFNIDRSRWDGLAAVCRVQHSSRSKSAYVPAHPRLKLQGFTVPTRDGDKRQARRRINYLVEQGIIPRPEELSCTDCGDDAASSAFRHEYDHARGYDGENQLYVEAVCSRCHHAREESRRERKN